MSISPTSHPSLRGAAGAGAAPYLDYRPLADNEPAVADMLARPECAWIARATPELIAALCDSPPEATSGHPDPLGPGVLFLQNDLTPCWRAAVAWALGEINDPRAIPVLLDTVQNLKNATDTRHAAAEALSNIADPQTRTILRALAKDYPEVSTRRALLLGAY